MGVRQTHLTFPSSFRLDALNTLSRLKKIWLLIFHSQDKVNGDTNVSESSGDEAENWEAVNPKEESPVDKVRHRWSAGLNQKVSDRSKYRHTQCLKHAAYINKSFLVLPICCVKAPCSEGVWLEFAHTS